jgi:hypothetical protein
MISVLSLHVLGAARSKRPWRSIGRHRGASGAGAPCASLVEWWVTSCQRPPLSRVLA